MSESFWEMLSGSGLGVFLALFAANSWAISFIFTRLGLEAGMKPAQATLVSLISSFGVIAVMASLVDIRALLAVPPGVVLWFAGVGILNFPVGRLLNFLSVHRLGAARSAPVLAISPLFALALAVALAGERPSLTVLAGTVAILAGIITIVTERST